MNTASQGTGRRFSFPFDSSSRDPIDFNGKAGSYVGSKPAHLTPNANDQFSIWRTYGAKEDAGAGRYDAVKNEAPGTKQGVRKARWRHCHPRPAKTFKARTTKATGPGFAKSARQREKGRGQSGRRRQLRG